MLRKADKNISRKKRHLRVRKNISGTATKPRLNVFRSLNNMYVQVIDDVNGVTLVAASTLDKEVKEAVKYGKSDEIEEEYGDLLFAVVNLGRHLKVTPEIALTKASDKFVNRFKEMEEKAVSDGKDMAELSAKELDELWEFVKKA